MHKKSRRELLPPAADLARFPVSDVVDRIRCNMLLRQHQSSLLLLATCIRHVAVRQGHRRRRFHHIGMRCCHRILKRFVRCAPHRFCMRWQHSRHIVPKSASIISRSVLHSHFLPLLFLLFLPHNRPIVSSISMLYLSFYLRKGCRVHSCRYFLQKVFR